LQLEATQLRNVLLAFRFRHRGSVAIDPSRAIAGVEPRTNQTALALLSLVDDVGLRKRIAAALAGDADRLRQDRADTLEATMISALVDTFAAASAPYATVGNAAERFNRAAGVELGRPMTNRWVGGFIRNRLRLVTMKSRCRRVKSQRWMRWRSGSASTKAERRELTEKRDWILPRASGATL
jgi:hypothetical protein